MAIRDGDYLKSRFADGARPTGADFADLVDSCVNASLTAQLASARAELLDQIELTDNELNTVINTVYSKLSAEDVYLKYMDSLIQTRLSAAEDTLTIATNSINSLTQDVSSTIITTVKNAIDISDNKSILSSGISKSVPLCDACNTTLYFENGVVTRYISNGIWYPPELAPVPSPTPTPTATIVPSPTPTVELRTSTTSR